MRHWFSLVCGLALLAGCASALGHGGHQSPARIDSFAGEDLPVSAPVEIRWDRHGIPFITAETDEDAAFALGYVHAHLRLGQMAVAREIVAGRISEMAGPWAVDVDAALRGMDFGRAAPEIHAAMPDHARQWLDRFVQGVNSYAGRLGPGEWPDEFLLAGIDWQPWRAEDTITLGRLSGIDINWGTYVRMLGIEDPALREQTFERLAEAGRTGRATFGDSRASADNLGGFAMLAELGRMAGKAGSNSMVVGPERSASGAPLIANDPHLGFILPNIWVIAGLRSPSYEVVGMMVPGTPVFGFGRNRDLAWGGTNLRATTSELIDISDLPPEDIRTVRHEIGVRLWFDEVRETRETPYGPVLTGTFPFLQTDFAVRWVGHRVTDEITALLGAMRARRVPEFRAAMKTFALPPQTFLVADTEGTIASVIAATVPARPAGDPLRVLTRPDRSDRHWARLVSAPDLPFVVNPPKGVLASANNRPAPDARYPFGGIFPPDERIRRLDERLAERAVWTLTDLGKVQMDTVSVLAREMLDRARPHLSAWQPRSAGEASAIRTLLDWDHDYGVDSAGAPVYEAFVVGLIPALYQTLGDPGLPERVGDSYLRPFAYEDLSRLDAQGWNIVLAAALGSATEMAARDIVWGDIHRIDVGHLFSRVPGIGGLFRERRLPVQGSQTTIFKTSHGTSLEPHTARFGAQSRHLSDLSDPDENYFVLFGGQDGWIGARNFSDQVDLWRTGRSIRFPLTRAGVASAFPHVTRLTP